APWLPPGWRLGGEVQVGASLGGTVGQPEYRGEISGSKLSVRNLFEGIHLQQGTLAVALDGAGATVQQAEFRDGAGEGWLRITGRAGFTAGATADLRVALDKLRLLDRYDRRITATGSADLSLRAQALTARGSFTIDEGLVDATQADAPSLSKDVVVLNRAPLGPTRVAGAPGASAADAKAPPATAPPAQAASTDVDLRVDLGRALRLRGRGLDTLLRGQLRVTTPGGRLAINGVVRAEEGTYAAYGQNLRIERGNLIFSGEVAMPRLDIMALRGDIDERVGVVVTGTAVNPRVRLYSEPALGELDTLTWLVLGRAPGGVGRDDTALLQRAALALLAGESGGGDGFLQQLGLDELSLSRSTAGGVNDTVVSLGKQISKRVYVGYEHALGAAGGTLQLIYRIANRITLRLRTGEENAIDAIWTWRWD
ncbi:MAG: translocation/assembly module TamB domain-containing protein, partial [Rubrivivax sp.]|nr:translocation/assembly module TamB domain-containing protein [Rubrivivax sp.]